MNCLRCGKKVPEGCTFCEACQQVVSRPLEPSPYLSTQVVIPKKRPRPQPVKAGKKAEKRTEKAAPSKAAIPVLAGLCLLLAGMLAMLTLYLFDLYPLKAEAADLKTQLQTLQEENQALQEDNQALTRQQEDNLRRQAALEEIGRQYVFVGPTKGSMYHHPDCPYAQMEGRKIMVLPVAILRGYHPCPECQQ